MSLLDRLSNQVGYSVGAVPADLVTLRRLSWAGEEGRDYRDDRVFEHLANLDFVLIEMESFRRSAMPHLLSRLPSKLRRQGLVVLHGPESPSLEFPDLRWAHEIRAVPSVEFLAEEVRGGTRYLIFENRNPASPEAAGSEVSQSDEVTVRSLFYRLGDRLETRLAERPQLKKTVTRSLQGSWRGLKRIASIFR